LFDQIAPASTERNGGYTRIIRLGQRQSDSASMAFIEWVDAPATVEEKPAEEKKAKKEKAPKAETKAEAKPKETKHEEAKVEEKVAEEPKKKRRWFGRKSGDEK
jgi:large subunit ribosomal protein L17